MPNVRRACIGFSWCPEFWLKILGLCQNGDGFLSSKGWVRASLWRPPPDSLNWPCCWDDGTLTQNSSRPNVDLYNRTKLIDFSLGLTERKEPWEGWGKPETLGHHVQRQPSRGFFKSQFCVGIIHVFLFGGLCTDIFLSTTSKAFYHLPHKTGHQNTNCLPSGITLFFPRILETLFNFLPVFKDSEKAILVKLLMYLKGWAGFSSLPEA